MAELQSRGLDPHDFLKRIGFDSTRLGELRDTLSLQELDVMACSAMALTGDPGLGLAIGAQAPESMLQIFGHLLVAQHTLRDSIAIMRRYSALLSE
ncbi:MAG TPA: AraC family transcriptional regulator ligand-binding domain-containing protein, partial [Polyangiaceae bacterium]|nr:AraC family transcriptional regulator ligand-binding domain-containing protein [Polyangiaceae bacterium]